MLRITFVNSKVCGTLCFFPICGSEKPLKQSETKQSETTRETHNPVLVSAYSKIELLKRKLIGDHTSNCQQKKRTKARNWDVIVIA